MSRGAAKFLPLLLPYLALVILLSSTEFVNDEASYVKFATQLSQGFQSYGQMTLWWGPGYPLVLTPFVLLNLPWLAAKLLNAFFLLAAVIYFYGTLVLYVQPKYATIITLLLAIYPPLFRGIHLLMTESLAIFLVCGFMFHFCKVHGDPAKSRLHLLAASLYLAYLALTKIFFGYVISAGLLTSLVLFLLRRTDKAKKTTFVYLAALAFCMPYLLYTYSLTRKVFYWGSSGGEQLYWMSASYNSNELGSWLSTDWVKVLPLSPYTTHEWGSWLTPENIKELPLSPHRVLFERLSGLSVVEMDDALKTQAIQNIIHSPITYLKNWLANIGRLLFQYPMSYTSQKLSTYSYILPNMFIVVLFALGVYPAILRRRSVPHEIYALLAFFLIAFGGSSLLSAFVREFTVLVPVLLLWLSVVYVRILRIGIRSEAEMSEL